MFVEGLRGGLERFGALFLEEVGDGFVIGAPEGLTDLDGEIARDEEPVVAQEMGEQGGGDEVQGRAGGGEGEVGAKAVFEHGAFTKKSAGRNVGETGISDLGCGCRGEGDVAIEHEVEAVGRLTFLVDGRVGSGREQAAFGENGIERDGAQIGTEGVALERMEKALARPVGCG